MLNRQTDIDSRQIQKKKPVYTEIEDTITDNIFNQSRPRM